MCWARGASVGLKVQHSCSEIVRLIIVLASTTVRVCGNRKLKFFILLCGGEVRYIYIFCWCGFATFGWLLHYVSHYKHANKYQYLSRFYPSKQLLWTKARPHRLTITPWRFSDVSHNFISGRLVTVWPAWENHWCSLKKFMVSFLVLWDYYCDIQMQKNPTGIPALHQTSVTTPAKTLFTNQFESPDYFQKTHMLSNKTSIWMQITY